jgi:hypothetical protein
MSRKYVDGEWRRGRVKLLPEWASEIRRRHATGERLSRIAADYGLTLEGARQVIRGRVHKGII